MKNLISMILLASSLGAFAQSECAYKVIESAQEVAILPVYEASVMYVFDGKEKSAFATINWRANNEESFKCFEQIEAKYPKLKAISAKIRMSDVKLEVFKGLNSDTSGIYPEAGGFYFGEGSVKVDYKAKAEILKAIARGEPLIKITSDSYFTYEPLVSTEIATLECQSSKDNKGVLALHKRLGEIIKQMSFYPASKGVAKEQVLDQFMNSCVSFSEVDADSFESFQKKSLKKTELVKGQIKVMGQERGFKRQEVELISKQSSTALEI